MRFLFVSIFTCLLLIKQDREFVCQAAKIFPIFHFLYFIYTIHPQVCAPLTFTPVPQEGLPQTATTKPKAELYRTSEGNTSRRAELIRTAQRTNPRTEARGYRRDGRGYTNLWLYNVALKSEVGFQIACCLLKQEVSSHCASQRHPAASAGEEVTLRLTSSLAVADIITQGIIADLSIHSLHILLLISA